MENDESAVRIAFLTPRRNKIYPIISFCVFFLITVILLNGEAIVLCCGPIVGLIASFLAIWIETDIIMMKNKSEYDKFKEDFLKQINDSKALELQIQKDRKLSTFAKKNFPKRA